MPPRKRNTIRVILFPRLSGDKWHLCRVNSLDPMPRARGLRVILEHVDEAQACRTHTVKLPQLRPAGLTYDLLTAAGIEVAPDKDIDLAEAEGALVKVRFRPVDEDSYEPVAFRAAEKENSRG